MKTLRMILFIASIYSTPTLAQSVAVENKMQMESEGLAWSSTIISSQDDDITIRVHRLPCSNIANTISNHEDSIEKVSIVIHKLIED